MRLTHAPDAPDARASRDSIFVADIPQHEAMRVEERRGKKTFGVERGYLTGGRREES